jgi:GNAT superfamily N-acetyltransferase
MRIEKYTPERLKEFLESDMYRDMPYIPVSRHRAESWLQNPRLEPDDIIMYLGFEGEDMIAYRGILPDRHGEVRFGWLSGIWVRPDHRRMGMASRLIMEAYEDWGHRLMVTNYAPEAGAVFDKSGHFELYFARPGMRYYQRSNLSVLLGNRRTLYRRSRPLLDLTDAVLNNLQDLRIRMHRETPGKLIVEEKPIMDFDAVDFLQKHKGTGFSLRGMEEFYWITSYPWIITGPGKDERYFFSSVAPAFKNICLTLREEDGSIRGFLWIVVNGEKMSLPYAVLRPGKGIDISPVLRKYMQTHRVAYLTSYQGRINETFQPGPLLNRRRMIQKYFATMDLMKHLPDPGSVVFQDGDGDVVFV